MAEVNYSRTLKIDGTEDIHFTDFMARISENQVGSKL